MEPADDVIGIHFYLSYKLAKGKSIQSIEDNIIIDMYHDKNGNPKAKIFKTPMGKLHRIDGPAIERSGGTKEWWVNGKKHRIDGPAVEHPSGYKEWWVNGEFQGRMDLL